jgi:hypothetical protein
MPRTTHGNIRSATFLNMEPLVWRGGFTAEEHLHPDLARVAWWGLWRREAIPLDLPGQPNLAWVWSTISRGTLGRRGVLRR